MQNLTMAIFILLAGFLMGIGFTTFLKQDSSAPTFDEMASYQDNLTALSVKVSSLTQKLDTIASKQVRPRTVTPVAAPAKRVEPVIEAKPVRLIPVQPVAQNPAVIATNQEQVTKVDAEKQAISELSSKMNFTEAELLFQQEPYDQEWSLSQQENIYALINNSEKFSGLFINEVACRSKSCRIELGISDLNLEKHMEAVVVGELGQQFPNATWKREDNYMTLLISTAN